MALNKIVTNSLSDESVTTSNIEDGAITSGKIDSSTTISISKTPIGALPPTITSLDTSQINPSSGATVTITGTRFVSIPNVVFVNTSTGARINASAIGFTSSTTLTATFPSGQTPGTYKVQVENPDGQGVLSTASIIYSIAPTWSTAANLGSVEEGESVNISLVAYDDDSTAVTSYSLQSGSLPSGVTLSGDSTIGTLTGTAPTVSADTAYTFTIRATDNENQTSDKEFTLTITNWTVANSLRFDDGSSDRLNYSVSSTTNTYTWTFSTWIKRANLGISDGLLIGQEIDGTNFDFIRFNSSDRLFYLGRYSNTDYRKETNRVFRDTSAWYHIVVARNGSSINIYVNGVQETSFLTDNTFPSTTGKFNTSGSDIAIGGRTVNVNYLPAYFSETVWIDGQQLDPTSFGETDSASGIWKPKKISGLTFGTNGFYLPFTNSGSLGADSSGNSNNFTVNNLTSIDQVTDTPQNNYATINPLDNYYPASTFSEGNCQIVTGSTPFCWNTGTFGLNTGKWYWETELDAESSGGSALFGISDKPAVQNNNELGGTSTSYAYLSSGNFRTNNTNTSNGVSATVGDIIGIALNLDANQISYYKNGTIIGSAQSITAPSSTSTGVYFPAWGDWLDPGTVTFKANFGNPPFTIASGNADANGYGNFEYAPPSGYFALNTKNLAEYG